MRVHLKDFRDGLLAGLRMMEKSADEGSNLGSFQLPILPHQSSWRYARGPKTIRLSDGQRVYSFDVSGEAYPDREYEVIPKILDPIDLEVDTEQSGAAQVHRADPDHIYFTLQEGRENPTLTVRRTLDGKWVVMPKQKIRKVVQQEQNLPVVEMNSPEQAVNAAGLMLSDMAQEKTSEERGFLDSMLDTVVKLPGQLNRLGGVAVEEAINLPGRVFFAPASIGGIKGVPDWLTRGAVGLGLGGLYDFGRRRFYNTDKENEKETEFDRSLRYIAPAIGLPLVGGFQKSLFPHHKPWQGMIPKKQ
jgi:hypothetical protein